MRLRNAALVIAVMLTLSGIAIGQRITGSIDGRVTDPSGAVLPGVEISVTNDATQQSRTTITNETGLYSVPLLPSGTYTVDTDEELIDGLSFLAYRRTATLLHLPATSNRVGVSEMVTVHPDDLDAALKRDAPEAI